MCFRWWFIEKTDQFIGNTAIEFNDEVIAVEFEMK